MKKIFLIVLTVLIIVALCVYPFLLEKNGIEGEHVINPVAFKFEESLHTIYGQSTEITLVVNATDVTKMQLFLQDSMLFEWGNPKGELKYNLNPSVFGVGVYDLNLKATYGQDEEFVDNRTVEVVSNIVPKKRFAKVLNVFPHNVSSFTQGFEFYKGFLYESTGQKGASILAKTNLNSGEILEQRNLSNEYFGEGITILNDTVYQVTWMDNTCFVYTIDSLKPIKTFSYNGEGWGLCNNGKQILMSDGSHIIKYIDPKTFKTVKTLQVYSDKGPEIKLNELEYLDGKIYANVWTSNRILIIDAETGRVEVEVDGTELMEVGRNGGEVMNGIAYNPQDKHFYFTGKNWSKVMKAEFINFAKP